MLPDPIGSQSRHNAGPRAATAAQTGRWRPPLSPTCVPQLVRVSLYEQTSAMLNAVAKREPALLRAMGVDPEAACSSQGYCDPPKVLDGIRGWVRTLQLDQESNPNFVDSIIGLADAAGQGRGWSGTRAETLKLAPPKALEGLLALLGAGLSQGTKGDRLQALREAWTPWVSTMPASEHLMSVFAVLTTLQLAVVTTFGAIGHFTSTDADRGGGGVLPLFVMADAHDAHEARERNYSAARGTASNVLVHPSYAQEVNVGLPDRFDVPVLVIGDEEHDPFDVCTCRAAIP